MSPILLALVPIGTGLIFSEGQRSGEASDGVPCYLARYAAIPSLAKRYSPPTKDKKTVAEIQYAMIAKKSCKFTSDDIFFQMFADRKNLTKAEYE